MTVDEIVRESGAKERTVRDWIGKGLVTPSKETRRSPAGRTLRLYEWREGQKHPEDIAVATAEAGAVATPTAATSAATPEKKPTLTLNQLRALQTSGDIIEEQQSALADMLPFSELNEMRNKEAFPLPFSKAWMNIAANAGYVGLALVQRATKGSGDRDRYEIHSEYEKVITPRKAVEMEKEYGEKLKKLGDITAKENKVKADASALAKRENGLPERKAAVDKAEKAVEKRLAALEKREAAIAPTEKRLTDKAAALAAREQKLAVEEKRLHDWQIELDRRQSETDVRS